MWPERRQQCGHLRHDLGVPTGLVGPLRVRDCLGERGDFGWLCGCRDTFGTDQGGCERFGPMEWSGGSVVGEDGAHKAGSRQAGERTP